MSYKQAMKWARKHPKGTKQDIIMSTGSGFWPSISWSENFHRPYIAACKEAFVEPVRGEVLYSKTLRGGPWSDLSFEALAERTIAHRIHETKQENLALTS